MQNVSAYVFTIGKKYMLIIVCYSLDESIVEK